MFARILCVAALLMLSVPALRADEVQVGKNTRLSGTILGMEGGKVRLGSEDLGEMSVPWGAVTDLRSDVDLAIYGEGGKVIVGVLAGIEGGVLKVKAADGEQSIGMEQVNQISTELPRGEKPSPVVKWKGKVEFGFGWVTGNSQRDNYLVGTEFRRRGPVTEIQLSAQGERGKTKGTPDKVDLAYSRGNLTINRNQAGRSYLSLSSSAEQDDVRRLMFRQNHSLSMGYRLLSKSPNMWSVEVGGNYVWEKYAPSWSSTGVRSADRNSNDGVTVRLRSLSEFRVFKKSRFKLNLVAYPSVKEPYGLRATNEATLAFPLTGALNLQLSAIHDYNTNKRPAGVKASDLRTRTTLVYGF